MFISKRKNERISPRPFHESIIGVLANASSDEMGLLGEIIETTIIPTNHDNIIEAWKKRKSDMYWRGGNDSVIISLLRQKQNVV